MGYSPYDDLSRDEINKLYDIHELAKSILNLDFDEDSEPQKIDYLIDGLIESGSINIFYGQPKKGKSLVLGDLAVSISLGNKWPRDATTAKSLVWYLAYEDPEGIERRAKVTFQEKFYSTQQPRNFLYSLMKSPPNIFSSLFEEAVELWLYEHNDSLRHVIVIDTLAMAMAKLGDENSSSAMGQVIDALRRLRNLGCTIFIIHHSGKDTSKGLRGHNSLEAAADSIFLVEKKLDSNVISIKRTQHRNGPGGEKFNFEIKTATLNCNSSEQIPYLEFKEYSDASTPADKVTAREVKVLNITEELLKTDPVNIRSVFGLQTDLLAIQLSQIEEAFIAKAIAPQAKSKASQRKALKRVLDSLVQKEMVHQQDGFYWLPDLDQTGSDTAEQ